MKIYISGDTKGFPEPGTRIKFDKVETFLKESNHSPFNPLKADCSKLAPWAVRLKALESCEGILLLDDWIRNPESQYEKYHSELTGKTVMFQSFIESEAQRIKREREIINRITGAIQEVTGMSLSQYTEEDRENKGFFNRMIFAVQCEKASIKSETIAIILNRDCTSVFRYLKNYKNEYEFNPCFRNLAERVNQKLFPEEEGAKLR